MMEIHFNKTAPVPTALANLDPAVAKTDPNITSDEIKRRTYVAMGWEAPQPEVKTEVIDPATALTPATTAPVPAAAPVAPIQPPAPTAPDHRQFIRDTALEVGREVARAIAPARSTPPPSTADFEMVEEDAEDYNVVQYLERTTPKHAGLAAKFLAFLKNLYAYEATWLAANPEKDFDPAAPEHDDYYNANPVPVDRKTLDNGKINMAAEAIYEAKAAPVMNKLKTDAIWKENAAEVYLQANTKVVEMVRLVMPAMADILTGPDGLPDLSAAKSKLADELDPVAYEVLNVSSKRLWEMVVVLEQTVLPGYDLKFDWNNETHATIMRAQLDEEARIARNPAEHVRDGKTFVSVNQWVAMTPQQKNTHWTLAADDMEALLVKTVAEQSKKSINHIDSLGKRKFAPNPSPTLERPIQATTPAAPAYQPPSNPRKVSSPSISSASDAVTPGVNGAPAKKSYGEEAVSTHFS